jgi:hypothetical protein
MNKDEKRRTSKKQLDETQPATNNRTNPHSLRERRPIHLTKMSQSWETMANSSAPPSSLFPSPMGTASSVSSPATAAAQPHAASPMEAIPASLSAASSPMTTPTYPSTPTPGAYGVNPTSVSSPPETFAGAAVGQAPAHYADPSQQPQLISSPAVSAAAASPAPGILPAPAQHLHTQQVGGG